MTTTERVQLMHQGVSLDHSPNTRGQSQQDDHRRHPRENVPEYMIMGNVKPSHQLDRRLECWDSRTSLNSPVSSLSSLQATEVDRLLDDLRRNEVENGVPSRRGPHGSVKSLNKDDSSEKFTRNKGRSSSLSSLSKKRHKKKRDDHSADETEKRAAPASVAPVSLLSAAAALAAEGERRNNGKGTCPLESYEESSMWTDATFDSEPCSTNDGATVRSAASTSVFSAGTGTSAYHDGNIWERIESKRSRAQQQESASRRDQENGGRDETAIKRSVYYMPLNSAEQNGNDSNRSQRGNSGKTDEVRLRFRGKPPPRREERRAWKRCQNRRIRSWRARARCRTRVILSKTTSAPTDSSRNQTR